MFWGLSLGADAHELLPDSGSAALVTPRQIFLSRGVNNGRNIDYINYIRCQAPFCSR